MGRVRRLSVITVVLLLAGCGTGAATARTSGASPRARTPARARPAAQPRGARRIQHVVWIWFENEGQSNVIGNGCCGYFTHLARTYGTATHYYAIGHYSADNYTGATSGSPCCFDDSYRQLSHQSIFSQLPNGQSRSLEESMPFPCDPGNSATYAVRHNPEAYFARTLGRGQCARYDTPYRTGSRPDLSAKFTFVTPNLCNDAHNCSAATADRWLAREMPLFMSTPQYRSRTTVIFVTFDESSSSPAQGPTAPPHNRVPMIVVSPGSRGQDATRWTHYSLLATTEQIFGLPKLGRASSAPTMCGHLGLVC